MKKIIHFFTQNRILHYSIFWVYNVTSLVAMGLFLAPALEEFFWRDIPWSVVLMIYFIIAIQFFALYLGGFSRLKRSPKKLVTFFFAVELPLFLFAFIRILAVRELTSALWLLLSMGLVSIVGFIAYLFKEKSDSKWKQGLLTLSQETALILQGYISLLLLFFLPILLVGFFRFIFVEIPFGELIEYVMDTRGLALFSFIFYALLFLLTFGMAFLMPIIAILAYRHSFKASYAHLVKLISKKRAKQLTYGFLSLIVLTFFIFSVQPKSESYQSEIEAFLEADSFEENQELSIELARNNDLKNHLAELYLASYQYLADQDADIVAEGYEEVLETSQELGVVLQNAFNGLARPFIYKGDFWTDKNNAETWYQALFDEHIQKGEQETILDTLDAAQISSAARSGLLDEGQANVRVIDRQIDAQISEDGQFARVSLEEQYQNKSDQSQEVYYEFFLPDNAVVTGLWLGPDLEFEGVVAPKGAAEATYSGQVRLRKDPALLEQMGPNQYRLRVFPIPTEPSFFEQRSEDFEEEGDQRVKIEYVTFLEKEGIPLPQFTVSRNVDEKHIKTDFMLDGEALSASEMTTHLPLEASNLLACSNKIMGFDEELVFVPHAANPALPDYDCNATESQLNLKDKKIALAVDASYSNRDFDLETFLQAIPTGLIEENQVDLYFFNTHVSQPITLNSERLKESFELHFLGQTERLMALKTLSESSEKYEALFMISDGAMSEISNSDDQDESASDLSDIPNSPAYLIHPDGPPLYSTELGNYIFKSRGGTHQSLAQALEAFQIRQISLDTQEIKDWEVVQATDQGMWLSPNQQPLQTIAKPIGLILIDNIDELEVGQEESLELPDFQDSWLFKNSSPAEDPDFLAVGAKFKIQSWIQDGDVGELETLDQLHQVAIDYNIASPYSSLLALVNDRQREELEWAEEQDDRFESEFNQGADFLPAPAGAGLLDIGGTPEPEEWLLMFLSAFILLAFYRQRITAWFKR